MDCSPKSLCPRVLLILWKAEWLSATVSDQKRVSQRWQISLKWQPFTYLRVQTGKTTNTDSSSRVNTGASALPQIGRVHLELLIGLITERPEAAPLTCLPLVPTANRSPGDLHRVSTNSTGRWDSLQVFGLFKALFIFSKHFFNKHALLLL